MADQTDVVAALDRVLTRLALTEDTNLGAVLTKLLPLVLGKLNQPTPEIQKAVLSILSHVNKRLKALPEIQLPLESLVQLYNDSSTGFMARNFALVYIEQAADRAPADLLFAHLDALVSGISTKPAQHQEMLLRLAMKALEHMSHQGNAFALGTEEEFASRYKFLSAATTATESPFPTAAADRGLFLEFGLKTILYQVPSTGRAVTALTQHQQQLGGLGMAAAAAAVAQFLDQPQAMDIDSGPSPQPAAANLPPAGLSFQDVSAVEGKSPIDPTTLQRRKLGLLNFTAAAGISPSDTLSLYLAASCDPNETVLKRGDELLKKRCAVDTTKPAVDMESKEVMEPLFVLFLGTLDDPTIPEKQRRAPVNPTLRNRLLSLFCRSAAAANCFPLTMTTITTCLYGAGTTPRTRQQGMEFAVWVFKHAEPAQLAPAAPVILESCLSLLGSGADAAAAGAAAMDTNALTMRSFTYQAVGHLAQRQPRAVEGRTDVAVRFFQGLGVEPPGVRAAVQEAISALATAFTGCTGSVADEILQLLSSSLSNHQEAVRAAALQWAVRLFPFDYIPARYLCIVGAGDGRFQIADAGLAGLQPSKFKTSIPSSAITNGTLPAVNGTSEPKYPALGAVLQYLCHRHPGLKTPVEEGQTLTLSAKCYSAAIEFTQGCWREEERSLDADTLVQYLVFLENALVREAPSDLHSTALAAMLAVAASSQALFASTYAPRSGLLTRLLSHTDAASRDAAGRMLGMLCSELSPTTTAHILESYTAIVASTRPASTASKKARFEEADGAAAALGYITAHCVSQLQTIPSVKEVAKAVSAALAELQVQAQEASDAVLKATAVLALGYASLGVALIPNQNTNSNPSSSISPAATESSVINTEFIAQCVPFAASLVEDKESKVSKKAIRALGFFCFAAAHAEDAVGSPAVEALIKLKASKSEELLFTAGEALSFAFGGVEISAQDILHTDFQSLSTWQEHHQQAEQDQKHIQPDTTPTTKAENQGSDPNKIQSQILDVLLLSPSTPLVSSTRPEERRSGAAWLVSLLTFIRNPHQLAVLKPLLPSMQDALCALLGDSDELTQEISSKGLSACYELADADTRQALVDSLMGTLSGNSAAAGQKKRRAGDVTADTKVFEPGTLGHVPGGGGISTYKEICALANEVGQPDLVYRFMQLANHQAALQASRGAAFGFASIAKLAGEQLTPHIHKLVPRLYRSLYDPQPKVRDAMRHIWSALFPDPHITLTQHLDTIAPALIADTGSNQWRVRESAALALADLLQGRKWDVLAPHFGGLWIAVFRVMDDVKETVRQAGLALARSVRGLTLRLADKESTPVAEGKAAVSAALPVLLEKGLPSRVPEIQGLAVETTAKLVAAAGPEVLKPHLTILVPAMLESLSGLEDSRLNYIEQHANRVGLDTSRLESVRVNVSQGGPVGSTLDACSRCIDGPTLVELTPKLAGLIRRGTGLNTRAGVGKFVTQVARKLGSESKAAAPQLMRALREACRSESSAAVKKAFATAHAVLARTADTGKVDKVVEAWIADGKGEDEDVDVRSIAGLMLKSLAREAPEVFGRHAAALAPIAYLVQYDTSEEVASVWSEVWEESVSSSGAGLRLHIAQVVDLICDNLKSPQWGRKKAAALAAQRVASEAGDTLGASAERLMHALLQEAPGRIWEGKESILGAIGALCKACAVPLQQAGEGDDVANQAVAALLDAASKKKTVYRKAGLEQLEVALSAFTTEKYFDLVLPLVEDICQGFVAAVNGPASMDTDTHTTNEAGAGAAITTGEEANGSSLPVAEAVACLVAAYQGCGTALVAQHAQQVASILADILSAAPKQPMQLALTKSSIKFAKQWVSIFSSSSTSNEPALASSTICEGAVRLLELAIKLAGDAKAAQLRESAVELAGYLVQGHWLDLPDAVSIKSRVKVALEDVEQREKLPGLKSQIQGILNKFGV